MKRSTLCLMAWVCVAAAQAQEADRVAPSPGPAGTDAANSGFVGNLLSRWPAAPLMSDFKPITTAEKFKLAWHDSTDPTTFALSAASAGISQWRDTHPALGQGMAGYGKRWATSYADYAINYAMTEAVFPSLLKQDHRYYRKGSGSFGSRMLHAASRTFVTYSDSGRQVFNTSEVAGDLVSVGISTAYYKDDRSVGTVAGRWGVYLAWDVAANALKEFWPDIAKKFQRK